jgi:hypothetical protein
MPLNTNDADMRAALSALTHGDYDTYCRWLTKQDTKRGIRTAGAGGEMRCMSTERRAAPDPYAAGIAKMRAAAGIVDMPRATLVDVIAPMWVFREEFYALASASRAAAANPTTGRVHLDPPDPYKAALDKRHQEGR